MFEEIIFTNDFINLILEENQVYIKVFKKGYSMNDFNNLLDQFPRLKLTKFVALKTAISNALSKMILIGFYRSEYELSVSSDRLKAYITINLTRDEFENKDKKKLLEKIIELCHEEGIVFGFDLNQLSNELRPGEKLVVANGILPQRGENAIIKLYELEEVKPQIIQDGSVNYYELNLINKVEKGDWVGERIEPKEGVTGKTVFGEIIPAQAGQQEPLKYDKKTIASMYNEEKKITYLTAKKTGAVVYENDVLSICNFLEIDGKVSFETGNVDFDGFVEIKESIEDNFSVKADYDIQVMGNMGVGGIDTIESRDGSVYIKGGIAGKNKATIICNGDFYTKFASDCTIECNGSVSIGYYALNCHIKAKEVILESYNSKIIGGEIEAQVRVIASEFGSRAEPYTKIAVTGFQRSKIKEEYDTINTAIEKTKENIGFLKQKIWIFSGTKLDDKGKIELSNLEAEKEKYTKNLKMLYEKRKKYISYLHAKGEGEVKINQAVHSNVHIKIKNHTIHISKKKGVPTTYYVLDGELKEG